MDKSYTAHLRHASYYKQVLKNINELYLVNIENGLNLFNIEQANIREGQKWAENNANSENIIVAQLCSDYASEGTEILRLHQRDQQENIQWLEVALTVAKKLNQYETQIKHLIGLGDAYTLAGDIDKAIDHYDQALVISIDNNNLAGERDALINLGLVYLTAGYGQSINYAIEYFEDALIVARELNDKPNESSIFTYIAMAYKQMQQHQKAIEHFEQALIISKEIGNKLSIAHDLDKLGKAYIDIGDPRKAIEFYQQQLTVTSELGDKQAEANVLDNIANAYSLLNEHLYAIDYYQKSLIIYQNTSHLREQAKNLFYLASEFNQISNNTQAIFYATNSLSIFQQIEDSYINKVQTLLTNLQAQNN